MTPVFQSLGAIVMDLARFWPLLRLTPGSSRPYKQVVLFEREAVRQEVKLLMHRRSYV
jgi:hypothetical protein